LPLAAEQLTEGELHSRKRRFALGPERKAATDAEGVLMSAVSSPTQPLTLPTSPYPIRLFSVAEYHQMIQACILTEEDAVELLEGCIVPKMARNPPHDGTIQIVDKVLSAHLPAGWVMRIQSAVTTSDSEPEPDLAIVRGDERSYLSRHPGPQDIGLVIEVAEATLTRDRLDKNRLYARSNIVCYWIVNIVDRQVEVFTKPSGPNPNPSYHQRQDYASADVVPLVLDGKEVARINVGSLLP
jgi:Uma2 family endonuclease